MEHRYVRGYETLYILMEDGALFNRKGEKLSPYINNVGYPCIKLHKAGKRQTHLIHRLVALAFVENPHPRKYKVVLHLDDDPTNTHKSNFRWGTQKMNMRDMILKGRGRHQYANN